MRQTATSRKDYDPELDFWGLVNWHLSHGTRAKRGLGPRRPGRVWTNKEFAKICGIGVRAVQYWRQTDIRKKRTVPPFLQPLEDVFFGDNEAYDGECSWRADLREAYAKAKKSVDHLHTGGLSTLGEEVVDKLVLDDPRAEGLHLSATMRFADSLVAKFEKDDFLERVADQDFLSRFLASGISNEVTRRFQWALITGPPGAGKTRLAIQFLRRAETQGFRVGFLDLENLKQFDGRGWWPNRPTLVVIDYAAQSPDPVARTLKGLIATVCKTGFEYPVRVLLLEREATGDWFNTIAPMDSKGASVRAFCYRENEERWDHPLTTLSSSALLAIMRGRLPSGGTELSDELLLGTLRRIDPPADEDDQQSTPRPLFAAATALKIADMIENGDHTSTVISELALSKLQRKDVLAWIISRERTHFWIDGYASDYRTERERLRVHENLLIIATIALDLPRQRFDDECPDASRKFLPNLETLDEDRFRRMAGGDPIRTFKRLEPDILGEFFVLDQLEKRSVRQRQSLIDAGLSLGGDESALFLVRCATDFGNEWRKLGFLKPAIPGAAMRAFAEAAFRLSYLLDDFDDVSAVISDAQELADHHADPVLHERAARALVNKGARLGALGRDDEAIAVYDSIVRRYGAASEPAMRHRVVDALVNKGITLGVLELKDEAIAVYDDIARRYGAASEPALGAKVAEALFNKGATLGVLGRNDEAIAVYDDIVDRYGAATEPTLCEKIADALFNKGHTLGALGRNEEAIADYDDIVDRYCAASEPALRERVAKALFNKGVTLGALGRNDEAIAVYDDIVNRYGAASEPVLRERVAKALVGKGGRLRVLGRNDEAIAVFDDIVNRYGAADEPALRELVAKALERRGVRRP